MLLFVIIPVPFIRQQDLEADLRPDHAFDLAMGHGGVG